MKPSCPTAAPQGAPPTAPKKAHPRVHRLCRDAALLAGCFLVAGAGAWGLERAAWESHWATDDARPVPTPSWVGPVVDTGPKVGDPAPDFALMTSDRKGTVTLSSFRGKRPVVLLFGSIT